jgi:hypothetical protein
MIVHPRSSTGIAFAELALDLALHLRDNIMKTDRALNSLLSSRSNHIAFFLLFLGIIFANFSQAYGQITRVVLTLSPNLSAAQILRVSDFNITGSGSVSQLFDLKIDSFSEIQAIIRFELVSDRFPAIPIVAAISNPIVINPGSNTITYQQIRGGDIDYNDQVVKELTDSILRTGRLPSGRYTFTVTVFNANQPNVPLLSDDEILDISNPTTLDLISPGAPVGRGECQLVYGTLPQFKWNSNANRFLITVCEALPTNSSPEDVMQNQPRLQRLVLRDLDFFGSPSFLYPSGDLPLEYGKTYYWQVQAIIESPSGEIQLPGEIWCFRIASLTNPGGDLMLQQLLNLLGSGEIEALFQAGGALHGYTLTGEAALNGRRMNISELLTQLRTRSIRAISVQVE